MNIVYFEVCSALFLLPREAESDPTNVSHLAGDALDVLYTPEDAGSILSVCRSPITKAIYQRLFQLTLGSIYVCNTAENCG